MNRKRWIALLLAMVMALGLVGCGGKTPDAAPGPEPDQSTDGAVTVTDMIGREVTVIPGSYQRVVCIGAGALRIYSYVGDAALLCGVGAAALAAKAAMGFGANLRQAEYEQVQRFSFANIERFSTASLITRLIIQSFDLETFGISITLVHTEQHISPVLSFCPTRAWVNFQDGIVMVIWFRQEQCHLVTCHNLIKFFERFFQLFLNTIIFFQHF